ncbi:hypothetical protein ykris0001_26980 [Yersinia kristensenii ATCC 33638]|nr:hypothetical protein ykris0001_26980 [Yersinia kristensenii ATCC 33638]
MGESNGICRAYLLNSSLALFRLFLLLDEKWPFTPQDRPDSGNP